MAWVLPTVIASLSALCVSLYIQQGTRTQWGNIPCSLRVQHPSGGVMTLHAANLNVLSCLAAEHEVDAVGHLYVTIDMAGSKAIECSYFIDCRTWQEALDRIAAIVDGRKRGTRVAEISVDACHPGSLPEPSAYWEEHP